jgi:N-acetylglutamate synthase-like GNAT family acetyltransferase
LKKGLRHSPPSSRDTEAIKALLAESGLPSEDIAPHLGDFIVAKASGELVGVVGLEVLGDVALLRSLAVRKPHRRGGLGQALCLRILAHAKRRGVKVAYLLTVTAADFFQKKLHFTPIDRSAAPSAIRTTHEFREVCPETASLLTRPL